MVYQDYYKVFDRIEADLMKRWKKTLNARQCFAVKPQRIIVIDYFGDNTFFVAFVRKGVVSGYGVMRTEHGFKGLPPAQWFRSVFKRKEW